MKSKLHSVYIFLGEEEFLKEQALNELKQKCFTSKDESSLAFNYISFNGESSSSKQIIEEAEQLPLFSSKRMVVVKNLEYVLDDLLLDYIKNPTATTCLVLLARKIDKRLSSYKIIKDHAKLIEFEHLKQQNLVDWICDYCKNNDKNISHTNAVYITNILENNLSGIQQELEKLISFTGSNKTISSEDIELCISENKIKDSFELTDAIQRKDTSQSLEIVNNLLNQGKSLPEIIGLIRWMLTRLWQGKEMIKDKRRNDIQKKLRIPYYFVSKFITQAEIFSINELKKGLNTLLDLERLMRTYTLPQRLILECLITQLSEPSLRS